MTPPEDRTLADLPTGAHARVAALRGEALLRERLAELGFVPGTAVTVLRRAPLGDPLQVAVRGGSFALRRDEAALVVVGPADGGRSTPA